MGNITTKEYLREYRPLKARIKKLDRQIKYAESHLVAEDSMGAISYDGISTSPTYQFHSIVEGSVIKTMEDLYRKKKEKELLEEVVKQIDIAVEEALNVDQKRIIKLKYLNEENFTWEQIAEVINVSASHCRQYLHEEALTKLSKVMKSYDIQIKKDAV